MSDDATAHSSGAPAWSSALHPTHCAKCRATFLIPSNAGAPFCPNCFAARLEPIPQLERAAAPELILPFTVADATRDANLERWQRDIPFKARSLNLKELHARLTRVFLPMYLADASVWGTWSAQMGFDYLVASSEERYNSGQWVTQRINETRIRWETRAGEIARKYENVPAPALENHARVMAALGDGNALPFDTTRALGFSSDGLNNALVRMPDLTPNAATISAQLEMERRAANDCQIASGAQHHEQFSLRAAFGEPNWTLMLLPMYVTSYSDDNGKWIPLRVNGQTGFVSGEKRASMKVARRWALLLGAIALLALLFTAFIALTSILAPPMLAVAGILLFVTLALCLAAPVPLIMAWQYNRQNPSE